MSKRNLGGAVNRATRRDIQFLRDRSSNAAPAIPEDPTKRDLYGRDALERILMGVGNEPVRDRGPSSPLTVVPAREFVAGFSTQQCDYCKVVCYPFAGYFARHGETYHRINRVPEGSPCVMVIFDPVAATPFCPNCHPQPK